MITYRTATVVDARSMATVQVKGWQTTYEEIVPDEFLNSMSIEDHAERMKVGLENKERRQTFFVAENEKSEVVAYIVGGETRFSEKYPEYDGELYAIYSLKEYRGQGIGKKLVQLLVDWLQENGFNQMIVWVLADNSAKYFYKALGAEYLDKDRLEISEKELEEYVYAWEDISQIEK